MCGIVCLVHFGEDGPVSTKPLVDANNLARHRGPDDEGYLLWKPGSAPTVYSGSETALRSIEARKLSPLPSSANYQIGFGHRRLNILDLSPAGHQPMIDATTGLAIVYNGEIYNYVELRRELEHKGYSFTSHTDTEVILAAWSFWGADCLHRFNGMFSFCLLDPRNGGTLHAVRDRFGVKPLYWARLGKMFVFASEIKQIRSLPWFSPRLDKGSVRDFLAASMLDHTSHSFDENIQQLRGGERAVLDLSRGDVQISRWYSLTPASWKGSGADAEARFKELLADSVRLRLRADVAVGSCLSGGLDSAAIVCLLKELLVAQNGTLNHITVTSCFEDERFDEWRFAKQVVNKTHATSLRVWPTMERLKDDFERHLWHLDEPCGSTSQFSQWCVFAGAAELGLKVMLSGQGSDEQLAGYGTNDTALMTGLFRRAAFRRMGGEAIAFHERTGTWPIDTMLTALRNLFPSRPQPDKNPDWLKLETPSHAENVAPHDLNESLIRQTLETSLPALLRFEDRLSMAWSIESRVPFMDYRLVEFIAGLPDHFKLCQGLTKRVMRESLRGVLPEDIRQRRDKMGFVTPQSVWLRETATDWFRRALNEALDTAPDFFDRDRVTAMLDAMIAGRIKFSFVPWRVITFGKWLNMNS